MCLLGSVRRRQDRWFEGKSTVVARLRDRMGGEEGRRGIAWALRAWLARRNVSFEGFLYFRCQGMW
jgi:hypothetical protein